MNWKYYEKGRVWIYIFNSFKERVQGEVEIK